MSVVKKIKFQKDFRCFSAKSEFDFGNANFVVLLGGNGSGKTTILKAIQDRFKKESFLDRRDDSFKKSCVVDLEKGIDSKKTTVLFLDYLHDNPKNAAYFSDDSDTMGLEIQSRWISSGQATQSGIGQKIGKFFSESEGTPAVVLFDQPETALDVGSMATICFVFMMRLQGQNKQIFIATHSSDWIRAMYLANIAIGEENQKGISVKFIDLSMPTVKIEGMDGAVNHNNEKQVDELNNYLDYLEKLGEIREKERKKQLKQIEKLEKQILKQMEQEADKKDSKKSSKVAPKSPKQKPKPSKSKK